MSVSLSTMAFKLLKSFIISDTFAPASQEKIYQVSSQIMLQIFGVNYDAIKQSFTLSLLHKQYDQKKIDKCL